MKYSNRTVILEKKKKALMLNTNKLYKPYPLNMFNLIN